VKRTLFALLFGCAFAAFPVLAAAQSVPEVDVSAGYMGSSDHTGSLAGIASLHGPGIGVVGLHPQLSGAFSSGGRYALTAEGVIPVEIHRTYVGGGLGIGRLDEQPFGTTGALYDVFAGTEFAPHLQLVGRYYGGLDRRAGQGLFVGLALRI
jgi:hypothetical protein